MRGAVDLLLRNGLLLLAGFADSGEFDMVTEDQISGGASGLGNQLVDNGYIDVVHLAAGRATDVVVGLCGGVKSFLCAPYLDF